MAKPKKKKQSSPLTLVKDWEDLKAGRIKFRTWRINPATRRRTMTMKGIEDFRRERASSLKTLRSCELGMSQAELARAIQVSPRTLQGWEIGRSLVPGPVMILLRLMRELPEIRRRLAAFPPAY